MNTLFLKKIDAIIGSGLTHLLTRPAPMDSPPTDVRRLLLIRPGGIGDAVLLVPVLRALRRRWPEAKLHVLAERRNAAVFGMCPDVDAVFRYDKPKELLTALGGRYDVVIDSEQWHTLSAVIGRLIRSSVKIGFATNARKKLFNGPVAYGQRAYEAESFLDLLRPLGFDSSKDLQIPFLEIDPAVQGRAGELLGDLHNKSFVVLFPGASIPERRWGAENFKAVANALVEKGVPVVVVGGREDVAEGTKIVTGAGGLNLAGRASLPETAAVIARCAVLVSGDSGVLHLAVGLGRPTVSLFGPGIAEKWAPRGERHIVFRRDFPCSPCTRFGYTPPCPINARCLAEILPEEVSVAVGRLLVKLEAKNEGLSIGR